MNKTRLVYWFFVLLIVVLLVVAAIPIFASDLFRQPYSSSWRHIYRLMDAFSIDPFPTGGGAPPRFPYWRDPADAGIYFRNVTLTTEDGLELSAWFVPVGDTVTLTGTPTILLHHGLLERKEGMLHLVPWLHEAGYNVMLLDFRGHGQSDPYPTTVGPKEALDVRAALDWLDAEGVGDRVGGLGMSLGAAALVNTAAQDERLDALVLDSLFADWGDTDFASEYRLSPDWLVPGVPSPVDLLPQIQAPILIIHGEADVLEEEDHAYRLYDAANEPKDIWINDSGHAWSSWTYPDLYRQKILEFFAGALSNPNDGARPKSP
jgi:dipeptidyl aminopeptidase/acylaminoacyl peptidase